MKTLPAQTWSVREEAHRVRAEAMLAGHRERSGRGIKHPVEDFLFEYYPFRVSTLIRWHPGHGQLLTGEGAAKFGSRRDYVRLGPGVALDTAAVLRHRHRTVRQAYALLTALQRRRAEFGCFGMHEWAMVYGLRPDQTRHPELPLRFAPEQVAQVVRDRGLRCTHVDAYRFFTADSVPLNTKPLTRAGQVHDDQPGCLHVGMDLYRWAGRLSPLIDSELLLDCFDLARRIRTLDMAASPYDLRAHQLDPVRVETPRGRAEYAVRQQQFAEEAAPLRQRLINAIEALPQHLLHPETSTDTDSTDTGSTGSTDNTDSTAPAVDEPAMRAGTR